MILDVRTLAIITALSSLVFAFAMITVARSIPRENHLRDWQIGATLNASGTLLIGLRGLAPDFISVILANLAILIGLGYIYMGTRGLLQRPRTRPWHLWVPLLILPPFFWYTYTQPDVGMRIAITSLASAVFLASAAFEFWRHALQLRRSRLFVLHALTSVIFATGALLFIYRVWPALNGTATFDSASIMIAAPFLYAILFNVWLAIMVTITVSARLQEALLIERDHAEAANRAKGQFLANMSHEIRTPMNGVLGMLQILQGTTLSAEQRDYVKTMHHSAESLLTILNDILDFSKIEAGKLSLEHVAFRPRALITELHELFSPLADEKQLNLTLTVGDDVPEALLGDPARLRQVLTNLLGNALKFTLKGEIKLGLSCIPGSLTAESAWLRFEVTDTGIGMAPETLDGLFSVFFQADPTNTRRFGGTGLGLSITHQLVALMGGRIKVRSKLKDGSCFTIDLPCTTADPATIEDKLPGVDHCTTGSMRHVLVVEDNHTNQTVIGHMLDKLKIDFTIANNGLEALESLRQQTFDGVLMDCQMPDMDGFEATRRIRAGEAGEIARQVHIIAMTANAMKGDREACLDVGMNDFLAKPLAFEALAAHLAVQSNLSPSLATLPSTHAVFDAKTLLRQLGDSRELGIAVAASVRNDMSDYLQQLRAVCPEGDHDTALRLVHTMKGLSAQVGGFALTSCLEKGEAILREQETLNDVTYREINESWRALDTALAEFTAAPLSD